jgi:hypothetical protein
MLDNRINALREDFKDDLNRTKLSMQMNFIVELERLRVKQKSSFTSMRKNHSFIF